MVFFFEFIKHFIGFCDGVELDDVKWYRTEQIPVTECLIQPVQAEKQRNAHPMETREEHDEGVVVDQFFRVVFVDEEVAVEDGYVNRVQNGENQQDDGKPLRRFFDIRECGLDDEQDGKG